MISERLVHKSFVVKKYMDKACWNSEKELYKSLKNVVKELNGYLDLDTFNNNWNIAIGKMRLYCFMVLRFSKSLYESECPKAKKILLS